MKKKVKERKHAIDRVNWSYRDQFIYFPFNYFQPYRHLFSLLETKISIQSFENFNESNYSLRIIYLQGF